MPSSWVVRCRWQCWPSWFLDGSEDVSILFCSYLLFYSMPFVLIYQGHLVYSIFRTFMALLCVFVWPLLCIRPSFTKGEEWTCCSFHFVVSACPS